MVSVPHRAGRRPCAARATPLPSRGGSENRIISPEPPIIALVPVRRTSIRRLALAVGATFVIAAAIPHTTSAALSLALPSSDYPRGTVITTYPATNDKADLLLSPVHRSSFAHLRREDGIGWIQAALWFFQTGKGAAKQRHRTTFGYAINVFRSTNQARSALADSRIPSRPYRVAHLQGLLFQRSDAMQSLTYLFFVYKEIEVEAYYEYLGTAPSGLAHVLRHDFSRQASHLVHLARVYQQLMHQPARPTPTTTGTSTSVPTATRVPPTASPTAVPASPLPSPTSVPAQVPSPTATQVVVRTVAARASMTNPSYAPDTRATVQVEATVNGQPLAGARVAANFSFSGYGLSCSTLTGQSGIGACSVMVPEEPDGTQVPVAVQVIGPRGEQAATTTSFTVLHSSP